MAGVVVVFLTVTFVAAGIGLTAAAGFAVVVGIGLTTAAAGFAVVGAVVGAVAGAFITALVTAGFGDVVAAGRPLTVPCCAEVAAAVPRCPGTFEPRPPLLAALPMAAALPPGTTPFVGVPVAALPIAAPLPPGTTPFGCAVDANPVFALLVPGTRLGKFKLYCRTGMASAPFCAWSSSIVRL